jgi:prolyl-tRNA synthetase
LFRTAIEVGHIFNFGDRYSRPLNATVLDEDGQERPLLGGSYGIGPGRVVAALVEQRHQDDKAMAWPAAVAPYHVHLVALAATGEGVLELAEEAARALDAQGLEVLLDDRDLRPGEKFADADLIGCPIRLTVGKKSLEDGSLDMLVRNTGEDTRVPTAEIGERVKENL